MKDERQLSAYLLSVAAAPFIKKIGDGRIINISDWTSASERPRYQDYSAYYVSKAAIKAVVEVMASGTRPHNFSECDCSGPDDPAAESVGRGAAGSGGCDTAQTMGRRRRDCQDRDVFDGV